MYLDYHLLRTDSWVINLVFLKSKMVSSTEFLDFNT